MFKIRTLCAAIALFAAPLASADELSDSGEFLDGVAAIVNEGVVLKSQLRDQIEVISARAAEQGMQLPPRDILEEQILERLIVTEIQLQRAERIGLQISDEMLNEYIGNMARENGLAFEDMPEALALDGIDYRLFREQLRDEITVEQLRRIQVAQSIDVSEREIQQCIIGLEGNVVVNSDYNLSHIMLSFAEDANADTVAAAEEKINEIYQQVSDGADFRELAARYSDGPTALEGGSLGWRK